MFAALSPPRRRLVLALSVLLLVALVAVAVAIVMDSTSKGTTPVPQGDAGPVLLVPGYGGSTSALQPLATALRNSGRDVTVVDLPDNAQGDLNVQAQALGATAHATLARTGARSLDVVGYSAGGVVARLWVRGHGGAGLARRVVSLGSPQHGTDLAALGSLFSGACPTACQQLTPDSSVLAALNTGDETPAGPEWISVWTTHDDVVLPPDSASLSGAVDFSVQSVCPSDQVDHSGLPADPVVARIVLAALGVIATAPSGGCG